MTLSPGLLRSIGRAVTFTRNFPGAWSHRNVGLIERHSDLWEAA
jgi:hypothetical protein